MNSVNDLAAVERKSAAQDVRGQLVALIEGGSIPISSKLPSENELARRFGVSRPVVREALVGLQALGLTKTVNGKGCFVAAHQISPPMLLGRYTPAQLLEVRRCLEVPAARAAAERRTTADLGELAEVVAAMQTEKSPEQRKLLDASFHIAIARASGNPLFVKLIEDLRSILEEHSRAAAKVPGRRAEAVDEHRLIYDAIARRDADGAEKAMSDHLAAADNIYIVGPNKPPESL